MFKTGTNPLSRRVALLAAVLAVLHGAAAGAADPQPYTVAIAPTGDAALDQALKDSSNLVSLRDSAPVGPFALVTRARDDQSRLVTALNSYGHYAARVSMEVAGRSLDDTALPTVLEAATAPVPVVVGIDPGPVFHLRRVTLAGQVPAPARAALGVEPGALALASEVLAGRGRVLDALRSQGYALAKVDRPVAMLDAPAQALDVSYEVDTGPQVDLGPIGIGGLTRVDPAFVRRRLLVSQGERFDPAKIEAARQDLAQLGVFATVRARAAEQVDAAGQLPLAFDVTERPRHAVAATAEYSTDLGASVGVTFQHRNLFGQAEQLNLGAAATELGGSASRGTGYNVTASLTKPDVLRRNQSVQVNLQAIKENLDAYNRTAELGGITVSRKVAQVWTGSVGVQAQQSLITQEGVQRSYTLLALPLGLRYDSTGPEGLFEPTHGIKAAAVVTPTQVLVGRQATFTILQASGSTYINLGAPGRSIVAVRGLVGSVQGAGTFDLPPDERFYAGGGGTVRGYRYQSIGPRFASRRPTGGTSITAATVEYRQRFGESFGAAVFVDAGQVATSSTAFGSGLRAGAGVGARYYTAIGPVRLDVAVPLNKQRGDDTFELYIGIGQAF
jgi:translocation and assembly module TamA